MITADYNTELDILVVEEDDYDGFAQSIELGGFVVDLDEDGDVLGIEIIDATQKTPFTGEELDAIDEATLDLEKGEDVFRVTVTVTIRGRKNVISSQYPRPATA